MEALHATNSHVRRAKKPNEPEITGHNAHNDHRAGKKVCRKVSGTFPPALGFPTSPARPSKLFPRPVETSYKSLSMLCHGYINLRFFRSPRSTPTSLHFPLDFPPLLPLPLPGRRARGALNKNTLAPLSKQNRWINDGGQQ